MTDRFDQLVNEVLDQPHTQRGRLAQLLLWSLEEDVDEPAEVERAWEEELERRLQEWRSGRDPGVPAEQVIADLRERFAANAAPPPVTVRQIKGAVKALPHNELAAFRRWFQDFDAEAWDHEIEADAASGKLDALAEQALRGHLEDRSTPL